jgi:hypothetical protein
MASARRDWEYASGPAVGGEVPITSEPRAEEAPGVPGDPDSAGDRDATANPSASANPNATANPDATRDGVRRPRPGTETRVVEVAEPHLSPETNARLTEEVRAVVGADRVEVPRDRPHPSRGEGVPKRGMVAYMGTQRPMLLGSFAGAMFVGAVIALVTNTWWVLPLAAGVHALATMTVVAIIMRMTTTVEHPSPELAATLSDQGIRNPDEHFSRLIDEFSPRSRAETADIVSPANERDEEADVAPAGAAAVQSSSLSPNAGPSRAVRGGGTPDLVIWTVAVALFGLSIALPAAIGGGAMWYLTAVMVPALVGWMLFQRQVAHHGGDLHVRGRKPVAVVVVCTAAAVAVFCAVVAAAFSH